jgi:DNA-directed RNA polymerase specialized sigma24 family protein
MRDPHEFDQFYKDVRTRLLLLTYCLTGDLPSSRAAVRDGIVQAWHHWRKVSRLEDPEGWVRARACGHAQRRHTAKLWHREKGLDAGVKATLDALGKLPVTQRRTLLLSHLTTASLTEIAREVGVPRAEAERQLQAGTAQLSVLREVPTTSIRTLFEPVRAHLEDTRWPRATIVRRAGATRRRTHTVLGVAATVATLVATGALVTDAAGVRPTLAGERIAADSADSAGDAGDAAEAPAPDPAELVDGAMLTADQVAGAVPGRRWRVTGTDDNSRRDGLAMPCQTSRYADPTGTAARFRTFAAAGDRAVGATQATQASDGERAAGRAYTTALGWFAGCEDERAQLVDTESVAGVGDRAAVVVLHLWEAPGSVAVAGVARTGVYTTTVVTRSPVGEQPSVQAAARLLRGAVAGLCRLPGGGACGTAPAVRAVPPLAVGSVPGLLTEVDLPPVSGVTDPWVGTQPRIARDNDASTSCDDTDFSGGGVTNNVTRTFLIPDAKLADQFGLTETAGSLPEGRAKAFMAGVRARLAGCADRRMGTEVTRLVDRRGAHRELTVWRVSTDISDDETLDYLMGIVRDGTSVAQVGFIPDARVTMAPGAFPALVERALARLGSMPPPKRTR